MGDASRRPVVRALSGWRLLATVAAMTVGMMLGSGISDADIPASSADTAPGEAEMAQSAVTSPAPTVQDLVPIPSQPGFARPDGCRIGA